MKTARLKISGHVQGVFFRAKSKETALNNQLTGWARNNHEGSVEVCVSGEEASIEQFIEWCKKGPARALVTGVEVTYIPFEKFDSFEIIR